MASKTGYRCTLEPLPGLTSKGTLASKLTFPVVLGDLEIPEEFVHQEYDTIFSGQFSVPAQGPADARPLRQFDFESLVLSHRRPWAFANYPSPKAFIDQLLRIGRSREPVQLTLKAEKQEKNAVYRKVTLRNATQRYPYGQPEAVYLTISTVEYKEPEVKRGRLSAQASRAPGKPLPRKVKLKASDTLRSAARSYYGSSAQWRRLARANGLPNWGGDTPIKDHPKFKVGDSFLIPKNDKTSAPKPGSRTRRHSRHG